MRGAVRCVRERREPQGAQQLRGRRTAGRTTRKGGVQARTMAGALRLLQRDPPLLSRPVAPSAHRRPARPTRPAAARPRSEWQQPRAATNEGSTLKDPQASAQHTRDKAAEPGHLARVSGFRSAAVGCGDWSAMAGEPRGTDPRARVRARAGLRGRPQARLPCFHLQVHALALACQSCGASLACPASPAPPRRHAPPPTQAWGERMPPRAAAVRFCARRW